MTASIRDLKGIDKTEVFQKLEDFGHRFDEWFNQEGDEHERAPGLHPSEVSKCLRKAVYGLRGTARRGRPPPAWKWRFWHGHAIHDKLQSTFTKFAREWTGLNGGVLEVQHEVPISSEMSEAAERWGLVGHADTVFSLLPEPGAPPALRVVVEAKSKSKDEFESMKKPEEDHLDQATIYQACLDIPLTWVLYFDKGTQNYTKPKPPYATTFQHARWKKLQARFAEIHEAAGSKSLPDRTEGIHCKFCSFSWTCEPPRLQSKKNKLIELRWKKK